MADVTIHDVDPELLKRLEEQAEANHRSLQAELHEILEQASELSRARMRRLSAEWLERLRGSVQSDSTDLIREDRDSRLGAESSSK
jgi:plasmid stability protein